MVGLSKPLRLGRIPEAAASDVGFFMEQDPKKQGQNTPAELLDRLRRVAKLAPQDPELRIALARALLDNSLTEEAIGQIRSVIAMSPNHLEARKLLETALQLPLCAPHE
jgi:hypothetical protein